MHQSENIKIKLITVIYKDEYSWQFYCVSSPSHWLKFYAEAIIESEARTAVVQLKSEA